MLGAKLNWRIIARVIGVMLIILSGFMLFPMTCSLIFGSQDWYGFLVSAGFVLIAGSLLLLLKPKTKKIGKREGYLIVTGGWMMMTLGAMLPYFLTGSLSTFSEAFFESASGLTTTGASVFNDIEALPPGVLFWRSLTQWIGGMGVIVLTVAILPLLGIGGVELFVAEAPGPTSEKIHPRIKETAKRLWLIYVGLTGLLALILYFVSGLSGFDAINHALTTLSTGGFSTKNASVAHWNEPIVQYPIMLFMFLAGMNFTLIYFALRGKMRKLWRSDEFKTYVIGVVVIGLVITGLVRYHTGMGWEQSFRDSVFQVLSIVTTTGFVSADYTSWSNGLALLFFFLLFTGACAGSTSGGIKVIRHLVFFRNAFSEFKRILHPRAMIRIKIDGQSASGKVVTHILVFFLFYIILFVVSSILLIGVMYHYEEPFLTTIGAVATSLGNVGPAIGGVGPVDNFADIPAVAKVYLAVLMLIGRLELFTVLIIFSPAFWRAN